MSRLNPESRARFQSLSCAVLVCYWLAMFVGTHWPKFQLDDFPRNTDKVLHFLAYGGLSFLIAVFWSTKREVGLREVAWIVMVTFSYAIADELLQIPVGRSCDFFDALADWTGSMIGLSAFIAARHTLRRIAPA